jgi:hypothetical protein
MPNSERNASEEFAGCVPFGFEKDQVIIFFPRLGMGDEARRQKDARRIDFEASATRKADMEDYAAYLVGRLPGRDSQIRELLGRNEQFQALARRHYELHERLRQSPPADNPQRFQQIESQLQDIERQIEDLLAKG